MLVGRFCFATIFFALADGAVFRGVFRKGSIMARQNRRDIFDPNEVGSFHAVQRTVRRAWLRGADPVSGKSFRARQKGDAALFRGAELKTKETKTMSCVPLFLPLMQTAIGTLAATRQAQTIKPRQVLALLTLTTTKAIA
jgi:hypothetical protein